MVKVFLLIVVGLTAADDTKNAELFHKWGTQLAQSAAKLGVTPERLVYLCDKPTESDKGVTGPATKDAVVKALDTFAGQAGPDDVVFVTLVGHGDYNGKEAKFNLTGPDMTPDTFKPLLAKLKARQVVFVDTTSASGPFLGELSGAGRTIVTATRNGAETYDTLFAGYFIDALTSEAADLDKNRRISVLEAFQFASAEVARAYEREGLLVTEHAMLDDDGDKEGTQKIISTSKDGKVAGILSLGALDGGTTSTDPKVAALMEERRALERRIEGLHLMKEQMDPKKYESELEAAGIDLARKTREIRDAEAAGKK
jgi:hypothetical protein